MPNVPTNRGIGLSVVTARRRYRTDFGTARRSAKAPVAPQVIPRGVEKPWLLEEQVIRQVFLPLNLDKNSRHPFSSVLTELRRAAKTMLLS